MYKCAGCGGFHPIGSAGCNLDSRAQRGERGERDKSTRKFDILSLPTVEGLYFDLDDYVER
jgi:hypothetical protein